MGDIAKDLAMRERYVGIAHELASGHKSVAFQGNVTNGFGHGCVEVEVEGWLATQVELILCTHSSKPSWEGKPLS